MTAGIVSLCSGYGGLDLAVEDVLDARTRWVAETDSDAASVLRRRFPDAPNLGSVVPGGRLFEQEWHHIDADIVTAGFPCQPWSIAGQRKEFDDERDIWPEIAEIIAIIKPRMVVLENVAQFVNAGLRRTIGDLAHLGYVGGWGVVPASVAGAPHRRNRLFVVAHANGQRLERRWRHPGLGEGRHDAALPLPCLPDGLETYRPTLERWAGIVGRPPPDAFLSDAPNARWSEWMMGLPEGWVTDLVPNRRALRVLGNGVVPQQAAHALRLLAGWGVD